MSNQFDLEDIGNKLYVLLQKYNLPLEDYGVELTLVDNYKDKLTIDWHRQRSFSTKIIQKENIFDIELFLIDFQLIIDQTELLLVEAGISIFISETQFRILAKNSAYLMDNGLIILKTTKINGKKNYVQLICRQNLP